MTGIKYATLKGPESAAGSGWQRRPYLGLVPEIGEQSRTAEGLGHDSLSQRVTGLLPLFRIPGRGELNKKYPNRKIEYASDRLNEAKLELVSGLAWPMIRRGDLSFHLRQFIVAPASYPRPPIYY